MFTLLEVLPHPNKNTLALQLILSNAFQIIMQANQFTLLSLSLGSYISSAPIVAKKQPPFWKHESDESH